MTGRLNNNIHQKACNKCYVNETFNVFSLRSTEEESVMFLGPGRELILEGKLLP